jgi:hypothetical protein
MFFGRPPEFAGRLAAYIKIVGFRKSFGSVVAVDGLSVMVKWAIMAMEGPIRRDFSFGEMLPFYLKLTIFGMVCYIVGVCAFRRTENW